MHCIVFIVSLLFHVILLFLANDANAQAILLESTIVRCSHDEMLEDGTPKNPLQLASSFKGHPKLDLKLYSKCRKKLVITLRVTESSESYVPNALILIDRAKNILTKKSSRFGIPIAVKFHQEVLLQKYSLKYLYRVNAKMWEEVINTENRKNFTGCVDDDQAGIPTCGYIPGSSPKKTAGFCCSCQEHFNNVQQRGGQRCDTPQKTPEQLTSAHCLRSSPYWYNVYEIFPPTLYQKITFELFTSHENQNGSIYWEKMSGDDKGIVVDSDTPINAGGAMKVTYRPHVEGINPASVLFDSVGQRLLFPLPIPYFGSEQFPDPEPLKGTIEDQILIVPKTLMSPHGATCDHVGTQIDAFLNQPNPCREVRNACLKNQPFDLWEQDQGPYGDSNSRFRLTSYQSGHSPLLDLAGDYKTGAIYTGHTADSPTYVDIEIPADDIPIFAPGYNAFIESVLTDTGSEGAKIVAEVINKELVEAAFIVELVQCSLNFSQGDYMNLNVEMKSSQKKIGPLNAKYFHLDLHSFAIKQPIYCFIVLVNEFGESVAAREVTLKPLETCLCVHTCKCACGEKTNLQCEKIPEEGIIATGLISAIKTAEQLKAEEDSQFTKKYRWIFHWILVFHIVLLIFALFGWLQKHCAKPKPEKRSFPLHGEHDGSSSGSEFSDDKKLPSNFLEEVYDSKPSSTTSHVAATPSKSSQTVTNKAESLHMTQSETTSFIQEDADGGVSKVTFANHPQIKEPSVQALNVSSGPAISTQTSKGSRMRKPERKRRVTPSVHENPARTPSQTQPPVTKQGSKTSQTKVNSQTSASPGSPNSEPSHPQQSSGERNQQGPQSTDSTDCWIDNNNEDTDNIDSFINYCVSASSSKTSFGTWHRKRRDQYSAYDFLPEPKQKGWYS